MRLDLDKVTRLIRETAEQEVLPRYQKLAAHEVSEKGPGDLVTAADLEVERILTERLPELLPGSAVVGEEAVHKRPGVLALLEDNDRQPVWIIDPVDGTTNFSEGSPLFVVQVAVVLGRRTRAAWIHDPVRGFTAVAENGGGAWIDGNRLRVAEPVPFARMSGALYANPNRPGLTPEVREYRKRHNSYRRCVGQEYLSLVRGELHFALFTRLMPWDHAPGQHIHEEAGGYNRLVDGRRYHAGIDKGYLLSAPDEASWRSLRDRFITS